MQKGFLLVIGVIIIGTLLLVFGSKDTVKRNEAEKGVLALQEIVETSASRNFDYSLRKHEGSTGLNKESFEKSLYNGIIEQKKLGNYGADAEVSVDYVEDKDTGDLKMINVTVDDGKGNVITAAYEYDVNLNK